MSKLRWYMSIKKNMSSSNSCWNGNKTIQEQDTKWVSSMLTHAFFHDEEKCAWWIYVRGNTKFIMGVPERHSKHNREIYAEETWTRRTRPVDLHVHRASPTAYVKRHPPPHILPSMNLSVILKTPFVLAVTTWLLSLLHCSTHLPLYW